MMFLGLVTSCCPMAQAKDGRGGDGGSGGNSGHGGDDGHSGGDDKDDNDDDRDDRDENEDRSGEDDEDDRIRAAVKSGKAEPLRKILPAVRRRYPGEVIRIRLTGSGRTLMYRIRLIAADNRLIEVRVNAENGTIVGALEP